ncbi:hypothetical protein Tco_1109602 [Tanacetum coccineum]
MATNIKVHEGTTDPEDHLNRFASAANLGEWPMLIWCRTFQQTLDESVRGWFERLPLGSINEWSELREAFMTRWTIETGFILGVSEVMKSSSFMDSLKCPELAKRGDSRRDDGRKNHWRRNNYAPYQGDETSHKRLLSVKETVGNGTGIQEVELFGKGR